MDRSTFVMTDIWVSTNNELLDMETIVQELQRSYWAGHRSREEIARSLENSLCFGLYEHQALIGFARVISDKSTFAYLCDVFIIREKQRQGHGQTLLHQVLHHPDLLKVNWLLRTRDAHGLYEKFGFMKPQRPERYMEKLSK